jgi:hypothetical protein
VNSTNRQLKTPPAQGLAVDSSSPLASCPVFPDVHLLIEPGRFPGFTALPGPGSAFINPREIRIEAPSIAEGV